MSKFLRIQRYIEEFTVMASDHDGLGYAEQTWRLDGLPVRFHMETKGWLLCAKEVSLEIYTKPYCGNKWACGRDHWLVKGDDTGRITTVEDWWFDHISPNRYHSSKGDSNFFLLDPSDSMIDLFGITYRMDATQTVTMCLRDYLALEIKPVDYLPSKAVCQDCLIESWVKEND